MGQLDGKVAVITGAASGMGKASALLFAREGAHVVLADLNTPGGEASAEEASAAGPKCVFQRTDVSAEADVAALVARALKEFGRLDVMFNNAGIGGALGSIADIEVDDWDRTLAVCLRGVFLGIKHLRWRLMRAQGGGAIVSTASIAGIDGYPNLHAYCAAKAGVVNLTRSTAIELAADRIRVNSIGDPAAQSPPLILGGGTNYNKAATDACRRLVNAQPAAAGPARPRTSRRRRSSLPATRPASSPATAPGGRRRLHRRSARRRATGRGQERPRPATPPPSPAPRSKCSDARGAGSLHALIASGGRFRPR